MENLTKHYDYQAAINSVSFNIVLSTQSAGKV